MIAATTNERARRRVKSAGAHAVDVPDLSYSQAVPIVTRAWSHLYIDLVGCGGTGSWLAPSLARLCAVMREAGRSVSLSFWDPDTVEAGNVPRQNFCKAEVGCNKAEALALRYGAAWGLEIRAVPTQYDGSLGYVPPREMHLLVGCVDNAAGRRSIAESLHKHAGSLGTEEVPGVWWLDCGNARESGQVLLGSATDVGQLKSAFYPAGICRSLPSPAMQSRDLLEERPEEVASADLSCAQMAVANAQSLMVNQAVASVAADYLLRLCMSGGLKRFATYIDLPSGVSKSFYATPEAVGRAIGKEAKYFDAAAAKKSKRRRA